MAHPMKLRGRFAAKKLLIVRGVLMLSLSVLSAALNGIICGCPAGQNIRMV